jgi:SAM-dependent methyltransferase/uncharacterized protein YbaR (Trm112 family)
VQAEFAADYLRCPRCRRERTLTLTASESDEREVREGVLACSACGAEFAVRRGVAQLMVDPPEHVVREAEGLARFAEWMRAQGWDRTAVRALPDRDEGYWYVQGRSMHQLLNSVGFLPGQTLLDVGSNTCWATNQFARIGLRAIALDISTADLQGLYTSDYFLEDGTSYFERVLGSMHDMPLASGSLDYVYCCEVLHHNDPDGLRRTFEEAFRVLKPGGWLLVVNETLKTLRDRQGVNVEAVEQFEGYEHAYWASRYRWEAVRAGFLTKTIEPHYHPFFGDRHLELRQGTPPLRALAAGVAFGLRFSSLARHLYLLWLRHISGGVMFGMVGIKPPGRTSTASYRLPARILSSIAEGLARKRATRRSPAAARRREPGRP